MHDGLFCLAFKIEKEELCVSLPPLVQGDVSEWLKEHAWKVCIRQKRIESSNLSVSAKQNDAPLGALFFSER